MRPFNDNSNEGKKKPLKFSLVITARNRKNQYISFWF